MQLHIVPAPNGVNYLFSHLLRRGIPEVLAKLCIMQFESPKLPDLEHDCHLCAVPLTDAQYTARWFDHVPSDITGAAAESLIIKAKNKMNQTSLLFLQVLHLPSQ
jgi:hypothetical protein